MALDLSTLPDLRRTPPVEQQAVLAETLGVRACVVNLDGVETPAVAVMVLTAEGQRSVPFLFRPGFDWAGFAAEAEVAAARAAGDVSAEVVPPPVPAKVTCPGCGVAIFGDRAAAGICGACA